LPLLPAGSYAASAYEEAKKINYIDGIAESLSYKGEIERLSNNFPLLEKLSNEAIEWYRKTPNKKRLAETYYNLCFSLYAPKYVYRCDKKFRYLLQAL
jgi:hypothetical protein